MEKENLIYEDTSTPVGYPVGINGQSPVRNSIMYMYAPNFDFPFVEGASSYKYIVSFSDKELIFYDTTPRSSLSKIWNEIPVGNVKVEVASLDEKGNEIKVAGRKKFWKKASFCEGKYPPQARDYLENAKMILNYQYTTEPVQNLLNGEVPTRYRYPTKQLSAIIHGMARRVNICPESREESLNVVRAASDYLMSISEQKGSPLEGFAPTYKINEVEEQFHGLTMVTYPAEGVSAFVTAYKVTGDKKYLDFACMAGDTFIKYQGEDGSWPLFMRLCDGSETTKNRCLTIVHMKAFSDLFEVTGLDKYQKAADRAYMYLEENPIKTWNWEGQFEDTPATDPYMNLSKHDACLTAIYLSQHYSNDEEKMKTARKLLQFSEDMFVNWEKPFENGDVIYPEKGEGFYNHYWEQDQWIMPAVFEQYGCYTPVDASAAKLIMTYVAMYKAQGNPIDLAKAKALGDAVTRMTDDDGLESTWWAANHKRMEIWPNCMLMAEQALEQLHEVCM